MVSKRFPDSMRSATATWAGRLAIFAVVVAALSVIVIRSELLEIGPSLATFGAALVFACLAILLALVSFVGIWRYGQSGLGSAFLAIFLGGALLPYPAYLAYRTYKQPQITDVTTNTADPPRFDVIARLRERGTNDYSPEQARLQRAAYPDLETLQVSAPVQTVYDAAMTVVNKRKLRVVDARAPIAGRRDGTIEAVARSAIMGFRDYVMIRVRPAGNDSRVDIRSAARYPFLDFGGGNAARIRALNEEIDEVASAVQGKVERDAERAAERAEKERAKNPNQKKRDQRGNR
jgi:uncharacterized protein (DUF1499 family)